MKDSHDGEIHKLDPKDGKLIWKSKTKKRNLENVFLCCEDSVLLATPSHGMQAFGQVKYIICCYCY